MARTFACVSALIFLGFFTGRIEAAVLNVPADYKTIQAAIDRASAGDTVNVSSGKYKGNLKLKDNIILQGAGAEKTTIEGVAASSVIEGAKGAVIEGFTITGSGKKGTIGVTMDAGISGINAPMTIANNRITGNNTGIKLYYSPSNIINNEISDSNVYGVYFAYSDSLLANNIIRRSKSHGVYNSYANPEIVNNTITGNLVGIFSEVSRVAVKNNIIVKNSNSGVRWAEFLGSQDRAEPLLSHNDVWGNGEDYANVEPAKGDISKDPLFVDAGKNDFRLKDSSPAKKSGEKGVDMGAFGGVFAQTGIPSSPNEKSYASLKMRVETLIEPEYMSQSTWKEGNASGKGNFDAACVPCHGAQGKGDGLLADTLDVKPRNLSDGKLLSTRTDDFLSKVITDGGASVGFSENMMPFSNQYSAEEIRNIVKYIRAEICKCKYEEGK